MPLDYILCLKERYQDCSKFTVHDETAYLTIAPDRRQDAARVLIGAKMDENQKLTFISGIDNSLPLSDIEWLITSQGDGAYRFFYFSLNFYAADTTYVWQVKDSEGVITQYGHIVYVNGTYYTPKVASVINIQPEFTVGWENSWSVFDIATLETQILNDKLTIHIHDDIVTCKYEGCLLSEAEEIVDDELKGCCDATQFTKVQKMEFMLDAANSTNWQEKAPWAEVIIKESNKKFCC